MTPSAVNPLDRLDQQRAAMIEDEADEEIEQEETTAEEYTASSYIAEQRILLPSGKYIRLRPISLMTLVRRGEIPNTLIAAARKLISGDKKGLSTTSEQETELIDFVVMKMIASFTVTDAPQSACSSGEVSIESILECDKLAIFQYAWSGQAALRSFR